MFVSLRPVELTDDCRQIHSNIHQILLTQIVKCFIEYGIVDIKLADQSVAARFQVFTFYLVWVSFYLHKSHTTSFSFTLLVDEIKIWNGSHSVNRCHSSIQTSICTLIRFFSFQIWWIPSICRPHACRGGRGGGWEGWGGSLSLKNGRGRPWRGVLRAGRWPMGRTNKSGGQTLSIQRGCGGRGGVRGRSQGRFPRRSTFWCWHLLSWPQIKCFITSE